MFYFVQKPKWLRYFYGDCLWNVPAGEKTIYLSFDDGPDAEETPFVLETLDQYQAKASFFCLGKNVEQHESLYREIIARKHTVGNHTYSHFDGWKTANKKYFNDIAEATKYISSPLFRPPYGHITWNQVNRLKQNDFNLKTVLWNVLSADFDAHTTAEKCLQNVISNATDGSIVLFHDSAVAAKNMRYALPRVLDHFSEQGYAFKALQ